MRIPDIMNGTCVSRMRVRPGHRPRVLIARAFVIVRTSKPRPDFVLGALSFRICRTQRSALNILNARAFRTKSGRGIDVLNILNARAIRTPPIRHERTRIQDILDACRMSGISWTHVHSGRMEPGRRRPECARIQDIQEARAAS